jgi:hypothetical protein
MRNMRQAGVPLVRMSISGQNITDTEDRANARELTGTPIDCSGV